ncbi:hypothetical protein ACOMHN_027719 [Nucella lapillus]
MGPAVFDPAYDFTDDGFDAGSAVAWLQRHIRPGPVLVTEVDYIMRPSGVTRQPHCSTLAGCCGLGPLFPWCDHFSIKIMGNRHCVKQCW